MWGRPINREEMIVIGLFGSLFGKTGKEIGAPMAGRCVPIQEVPDPTFAEGILGQGVAIQPTDGKVYAPADGEITTLFPTGHAVAMTADSGAELLIHIGLDTVKLKGSAFTIHGKEESKVKKGDLLIEADLAAIQAAGLNTITPVVVCNPDDFSKLTCNTGKDVVPGDPILQLK